MEKELDPDTFETPTMATANELSSAGIPVICIIIKKNSKIEILRELSEPPANPEKPSNWHTTTMQELTQWGIRNPSSAAGLVYGYHTLMLCIGGYTRPKEEVADMLEDMLKLNEQKLFEKE